MTIHSLLPRTVAGYPIDFHELETGGLEIYVWRDEQRDDGLLYSVRDWTEAWRLIAVLKKAARGQK